MKNTEINWTEHTFNPWWGCVKVSPACDNCYAEAQSKRFGQDVWGKDAGRRRMSDKQWDEPLKWNKEARERGEHHRVFCASMADVFERREDLEPERRRLWTLIQSTPNLDWLLLTKRHDNVKLPWGDGKPWPNVWVGMSVENQQYADIRLPYLRRVNAVVKFVSAEPLLERVNFRLNEGGIDWVIVGGESGPKSRAMETEWVKDILHQCHEHKIPFHFKQWGEWGPIDQVRVPAELVVIQGQPRAVSNLPVRQFHEDGDWFVRQGKSMNENRLDRDLYVERPTPLRQEEAAENGCDRGREFDNAYPFRRKHLSRAKWIRLRNHSGQSGCPEGQQENSRRSWSRMSSRPRNPATERYTRVLQTLCFTLKVLSFTPPGTPNKPNDTCFR